MLITLAAIGLGTFGVFGSGFSLRALTRLSTLGSSVNINLLSGEWGYLPGETSIIGGLHIQHRGFEIVEQDGSGGQTNPPVNEYGTHLNVSGNFSISSILSDVDGSASEQIYSTPPIVSDEFRIEVPSVRLTVDNDNLTVGIWNGQETQDLSNQQPVVQQSYKFVADESGVVNLQVSDINKRLSFDVNGKDIGSLPDNDIFSSNQAWIGFDAESNNGSFTVTGLNAKPLKGGSVSAVNVAADLPITKDPNDLQMLADKKRPGFLIGSDAALWAATSNTQYSKVLFGGNFGIITPENAMKWQFTEPQPGVYDFHEADALVNLALKNGLQVHGHNLVFSEALPAWVQNLPTGTQEQDDYVQKVMVDHITALVSHFRGRVNEWDVVNEPIADYDNFDPVTNIYRDNVFLRAMGPDYIKIALEAAHKADPSAKLYINDYGNENDDGPRWQATYNMMSSLESELAPQGIHLYYGFESHIYDPTTDDISNDFADNGNTILQNNIDALGAIGIKSRISEMDAPESDPGYAEDSSSQTQQMSGVLSICLNDPNCVAFSIWSTGMTDMSQDNSTGPWTLQTGEVDSPFDQNNQPVEPTYNDLQSVLR